MLRKFIGSLLVFLGFWLSPLSPWNDLFTNIPLAYLFALPFSFISNTYFIIVFVMMYWLSNIAGFILMHYGYVHLKNKAKYSFKKNWKQYMLATSLYTLFVGALIYYGTLPSVTELQDFLF